MQRTHLIKLFGAMAACAIAALAQEPPPGQPGPENDPPSRAARMSFIQGTVSFQPGSVEDWVPATLNRPMTTGDRVWAETGARAEMHIGSAALRLNGRSNFAFLNLDDRTAQIQLSLGTMSVRVRRLAEDENFEIDTPQAAFSILRPGEYRVEVNENGDTTVFSVRGGEAEATSGGQAFPIKARDQVRITGLEQPAYDRREIPFPDVFDNWCADRDRREDLSESGRYVSRDIPGYHDLDGAGTWRQVPDYGWVWSPTVAVGWAPYHYGHWAWIAPWGWTWVDDAPWGYAPFHYGRWAFVGAAWVWVPGPVVVGVRPVYAPAMVAWVGGGGFSVGIGVGVGVAAVGWFPLGPREVWVPSYGVSAAYFSRVNVSNTVVNNVTVNNVYVNRTVINNTTYVNQNVAGAVSAMPQNAMTRGQPVQQAAIDVPRGAVARGTISPVAAVAPQREAVTGGGRNYTVAAPPPAVMNRQVMAKNTPPPAPVAFSQQQAALARNPGQPLPRATMQQMQQSSPAAPRAMVRQVGPQGGAGGPGGQSNGPSFVGRQPGGNQAGGGQPGGQNAGGTIPRPGVQASTPGGPPATGGGQPGGQGGTGGQPRFQQNESRPQPAAQSTTPQPAVRPEPSTRTSSPTPETSGQKKQQKKAQPREHESKER